MSAPIARDRRTTSILNDAEAIAEAVQRPTMKFVATKTAEQLDLQALHRVRERLVSQRTGFINQIRAFMLERGIAVRQGIGFLRTELPTILATRTDALSPRMLRVIEELAGDWRRLDPRIDGLATASASGSRRRSAGSRRSPSRRPTSVTLISRTGLCLRCQHLKSWCGCPSCAVTG